VNCAGSAAQKRCPKGREQRERRQHRGDEPELPSDRDCDAAREFDEDDQGQRDVRQRHADLREVAQGPGVVDQLDSACDDVEQGDQNALDGQGGG